MKKTLLILIAFLFSLTMSAQTYTLSNENIKVEIDKSGLLTVLQNNHTGHNYATGGYLWRIFYDAKYEKELMIAGDVQNPTISQEGNKIFIHYLDLKTRDGVVNMELCLTITLENDKVRFGSDIKNNEPNTIVREMQYPLVRNIKYPKDHKLFTAEAGGKLYDNPIKVVSKLESSPYKKPEQFFRQLNVKYGYKVFMNCFGLFGKKQGLYFGSHDETFQDTWHGLRAYKGDKGEFNQLECGFFKYPHCFSGETWSCHANVVSPYNGTWHNASDIYRAWADESWWDYKEPPTWVKKMRSWQRVIFKHQYGEYFFKYPDLYGHLKEVDKSVNCNSVFLFGWWAEGMDNGNPDYSPDESQGGDAALKEAIAKYQEDGSNLILYYNGKLIDRESKFYRSGMGPLVCRHDNTGSEILERYKFTGHGTWLGEYDQRTFAVATMMHPKWNEVLFALQDRAYNLGAKSVFFDQLGYIEGESTNWDYSREFPVPDVFGIAKRAECLRLLRDRYDVIDPEFAIGAEGTVDALAVNCDFTHGYPANQSKERFLDFFKYTFPELIFTDRGQRDDTDVYWNVNETVLDGQRNDIEIYRCRDLIDNTPIYQTYLYQVNLLKEKYEDLLLMGKFRDKVGVKVSNDKVSTSTFVNGDKMAVVVANQERSGKKLRTTIKVPGYKFVEATTLRDAKVSKRGKRVRLKQYDLAVLIFEKK